MAMGIIQRPMTYLEAATRKFKWEFKFQPIPSIKRTSWSLKNSLTLEKSSKFNVKKKYSNSLNLSSNKEYPDSIPLLKSFSKTTNSSPVVDVKVSAQATLVWSCSVKETRWWKTYSVSKFKGPSTTLLLSVQLGIQGKQAGWNISWYTRLQKTDWVLLCNGSIHLR